jgi:hypothetical protein
VGRSNLAGIAIEQGSVFAFLPAGFRLERPVDIKYHLESLDGRRVATYAMAVRFVSDYLRSLPNALALFQSDWHEGDPILSKLTTPYVLLAEESESRKVVCHFLISDQHSQASVSNAFREARPFTFLLVLTTLPQGWSLQHRHELPTDQARTLGSSCSVAHR